MHPPPKIWSSPFAIYSGLPVDSPLQSGLQLPSKDFDADGMPVQSDSDQESESLSTSTDESRDPSASQSTSGSDKTSLQCPSDLGSSAGSVILTGSTAPESNHHRTPVFSSESATPTVPYSTTPHSAVAIEAAMSSYTPSSTTSEPAPSTAMFHQWMAQQQQQADADRAERQADKADYLKAVASLDTTNICLDVLAVQLENERKGRAQDRVSSEKEIAALLQAHKQARALHEEEKAALAKAHERAKALHEEEKAALAKAYERDRAASAEEKAALTKEYKRERAARAEEKAALAEDYARDRAASAEEKAALAREYAKDKAEFERVHKALVAEIKAARDRITSLEALALSTVGFHLFSGAACQLIACLYDYRIIVSFLRYRAGFYPMRR